MPTSRELVVDAAFAILRRYPETHQLPTVQSVREYLGKGSPNTINEEVKVFWERLAARITLPVIPEGLQQAAAAFWEQAVDQGRVAFDEHRMTVDGELREARTAQHNAEQLAQRLDLDLSSARGEIARLTDSLRDKDAEFVLLVRNLDTEALGHRHVKQQLVEMKDRLSAQAHEYQKTLSSVRETTDRELDRLKLEHNRTLQLERERFTAMEKRDADQLEELQVQRLSLEHDFKQRTEERDMAYGEIMRLKTRIEAVESERERTVRQNNRLQEELTESKMQTAELTERIIATGREYVRRTEELEATFGIAQEKTQKQIEAINALRERVAGLDSEKRLLARELKALQRRKGKAV